MSSKRHPMLKLLPGCDLGRQFAARGWSVIDPERFQGWLQDVNQIHRLQTRGIMSAAVAAGCRARLARRISKACQ